MFRNGPLAYIHNLRKKSLVIESKFSAHIALPKDHEDHEKKREKRREREATEQKREEAQHTVTSKKKRGEEAVRSRNLRRSSADTRCTETKVG